MLLCLLLSCLLLCSQSDRSFAKKSLEGEMKILPDGANMTLEGCTNNTWYFNNTPVDAFVYVFQRNSGFYHCRVTNQIIYLLAHGKQGLEFTYDSVPRKYKLVGEAVDLTCRVEILGAKKATATSTVTITHSSGIDVCTKSVEIVKSSEYNQVTGKYEDLNKNGTELFYCHWKVSAKEGTWDSNGMDVTNLTIRVYSPPKNVKPDKVRVEVNQAVNCTSSASDPSPVYAWTCFDNVTWKGNGGTLTVSTAGTYLCACSATVDIEGDIYSDGWNGTIEVTVVGGSQMKFLNGVVGIAAVIMHFGY